MKGFCAISIQGKRHLLIQSCLDKLQLRIFRFSHRQLSFVVWVINPLPCRSMIERKVHDSSCVSEVGSKYLPSRGTKASSSTDTFDITVWSKLYWKEMVRESLNNGQGVHAIHLGTALGVR